MLKPIDTLIKLSLFALILSVPGITGAQGLSAEQLQCSATTNLALDGSASQSSTWRSNRFPANNAIDGNLGNFTHTDLNQSPASWQVTLDEDSVIEQIVLHNRDNCCGSRLRDVTVTILNSTGGVVYQSALLNPQNALNSPAFITLGLPQPVIGNTIQVQRTADPDLSGGAGGRSEPTVLSLGEVLVNGCALAETNFAFVPDPNKIYHIDNPAHGLRLAATADSEMLESRPLTSEGVNTQWQFVQSPTPGLWHIQRAAGGSTPRIRTVLSTTPDMQGTGSSGIWTRFSITPNSNRPGTYLLTLPEANTTQQRLRLLSSGVTDFATNNNVGDNPSFVFTEVTGDTITKPNILFVMLDDLGKDWVPQFGGGELEDGTQVHMPTVDQLANEGTSFRNFYVMPQCTPTRVSFLTGQYPNRHGWINHWDVPRWGGAYFDADRYNSVARLLKNAGYRTAAAGKWQINDFRVIPDAMVRAGFDEYMMWTGFEAGNGPSSNRYFEPYIHTVGPDGTPGSRTYNDAFGPDLFADFLADFIRDNTNEPWFAYYPMVLPHGPQTATPADPSASGQINRTRAMVEYTDILLKRLLDALDETGQADNTYVIWTTDNGTSDGTLQSVDGVPNRFGKQSLTEGGANTPLIIRGPSVAAGIESDTLVDITDMLPTFAELAGASLPAMSDQAFPDEPEWYAVDGQSLAPYLQGLNNDGPRSWIMSMGGGNTARLIEGPDGSPIMQNVSIHRDRQIRNKDFKVSFSSSPATTATNTNSDHSIFVGEDNGLFSDDRWGELNDISQTTDPAAQEAFDLLRKAHDAMPYLDNDPRYAPMDRPIYVPLRPASELDVWKR